MQDGLNDALRASQKLQNRADDKVRRAQVKAVNRVMKEQPGSVQVLYTKAMSFGQADEGNTSTGCDEEDAANEPVEAPGTRIPLGVHPVCIFCCDLVDDAFVRFAANFMLCILFASLEGARKSRCFEICIA